MRTTIIARAVISLLLLFGAAAAMAAPIRLSFRAATVTAGTTFDVPIYVDSTLTGLGVSSYEIVFNYSSPTVDFTGIVNVTGTLSDSWGPPTINATVPGQIRIAGAGVAALAGTGQLVVLRFSSPPRTSVQYPSFNFQSAKLNEGVPATVITNATFTINALPLVTVSPNTAVVVRGEQVSFSASGGRVPYSWSLTNLAVGSISGTGVLTGSSVGTTQVVAADADGIIDTSGTVEVRGMRVSLRDTSRFQGQMLDLPVYTTSLNGLSIISGRVTLFFNTTTWIPVGVVRTGTLTAGTNLVDFNAGTNSVTVSFSSTTPLAGNGVLFYVRMQASTSSSGYVGFSFGEVLFNQDLQAVKQGATVIATPLAAVNISPPSAFTMMTGDSVQFTASGGIPSYGWSVSDPAKASITSNGWLKAKRGGTITVRATDAVGGTGTSAAINIYDMRVILPDTTFTGKGQVEYPVRITANDTGFVSYQFLLSYATSNRMRMVGVNTVGSLSGGWSVLTSPLPSTNGSVTIAGASSGSSVISGGILLKFVFDIPDTAIRPSTMYMTFGSPSFNEGFPRPLVTNGSIVLSGTVDVERTQEIPSGFRLEQNYPNPFNPETVVSYQLPVASRIELRVFDALGREEAMLVDAVKSPGNYSVRFDGSRLPSGVYLCRMQVRSIEDGRSLFMQTRRLVLLK
jgi:hypothetical protein